MNPKLRIRIRRNIWRQITPGNLHWLDLAMIHGLLDEPEMYSFPGGKTLVVCATSRSLRQP